MSLSTLESTAVALASLERRPEIVEVRLGGILHKYYIDKGKKNTRHNPFQHRMSNFENITFCYLAYFDC